MDIWDYMLLSFVGCLGGTLNVIAGGGSLLIMPTLVLMGLVWVLIPKTPVLMIETLDGASISVRGSREIAKAPVHDPIPLRIGEAEFTVSRPGFRAEDFRTGLGPCLD